MYCLYILLLLLGLRYLSVWELRTLYYMCFYWRLNISEDSISSFFLIVFGFFIVGLLCFKLGLSVVFYIAFYYWIGVMARNWNIRYYFNERAIRDDK